MNNELNKNLVTNFSAKEAVEIADEAIFAYENRHLKDVEVAIIIGSCQKWNYCKIAQNNGYTSDYLRNDVGPQLWKLLSQALGEKVNKRSFQTALERRWRQQFQREQESQQHLISTSNLKIEKKKIEDWHEAPDVRIFYGRVEELNTLKEWVIGARCRLILLLGIGGIGKTTLSVKLGQELSEEFEYTIWYGLCNAPPLFEILEELILFLSEQQETNIPATVEKRISLLLKYLKASRCLLILDNGETILKPGLPVGRYRSGYQDYGELFKIIGQTNHQSCLLLTSREKPSGLTAIEGENLLTRTFQLQGLSTKEVQQIFANKGVFVGSPSEWLILNQRYCGNPLALNIIASIIRDLFANNISEFLAACKEGSFVFDDINDLLKQQWIRLGDLEQEIMYWLAINREPVPWQKLQQDLVFCKSSGEFIQTIASLQNRCLIEKVKSGFTQQTAILEYVTEQLIEKIFVELTSGKIDCFNRYALIKADAPDYIREAQICSILQPLMDRLSIFFGTNQSLENFLLQILAKLRSEFSSKPGYAGGNLLNLLRQLNVDLKGYDFSSLAIWQANLQEVDLARVNLGNCDLRKSIFTQTFASIYSIAFSPDGKFFAAGDVNGQVSLWDKTNNKPLWLSQEHKNNVWSLSFSPDGKFLASGAGDCSVKLWDTKTGICLNTLWPNIHNVWSVSFSPDGKFLASSGGDFSIKLWALKTGTCLNVLLGHSSEAIAIAFSPNGELIASGSADHSIKIWNINNGQCLKTLSEHSKWVCSVKFSSDGQLLASSSTDSLVKIWDIDRGKCLKTLILGDDNWIFSVAFTPDDRVLGIGCLDSSIKLWDVKQSKWLKNLSGYIYEIKSIAFNPDGKLLASVSHANIHGSIKLWDVKSASCLHTISDSCNRTSSMAFSPDGEKIVTSGSDSLVKLWDIKSQKCLKTFTGHKKWIWSVAFSPNGKMLASGSDDFSVKLWSLKQENCLKTFSGHTDCIWAVKFSPDSKILASGSYDRSIKLWDVHRGQCLQTLLGHTNWIFSLAFSPNGKLLASASTDSSIKLWDVHSGQCLQTLLGHTNWVWSIAFSPDGKLLASGSTDSSIKLWDVHSGQCLQTLLGHTNWVCSVAFSPDGQILASGGQNGTIKFWDLKTGQYLKTLRSPKPYEGTNIKSVTGLTLGEQTTLKLLGAVENYSF